MKKVLLFVLFVFIVAAITNPSENHFKNFIKTSFKLEVNDDFLTKGLKSVFNLQSQWTSIYDDKIFYSKAKTSVAKEDYEFIGVFGIWFETK